MNPTLAACVTASLAIFASAASGGPSGLGPGSICGDRTGPRQKCAPGYICHPYNNGQIYVCVSPGAAPPIPTKTELGPSATCGDFTGPFTTATCAPGLDCQPFADGFFYKCVGPAWR